MISNLKGFRGNSEKGSTLRSQYLKVHFEPLCIVILGEFLLFGLWDSKPLATYKLRFGALIAVPSLTGSLSGSPERPIGPPPRAVSSSAFLDLLFCLL